MEGKAVGDPTAPTRRAAAWPQRGRRAGPACPGRDSLCSAAVLLASLTAEAGSGKRHFTAPPRSLKGHG